MAIKTSELLGNQAGDDSLWELFHENSKITAVSRFPSDESVLSLIGVLHETLPFDGCKTVTLPETRLEGDLSAAIFGRNSERDLLRVGIPLEVLGGVLQAGGGISRDEREKGYPRRFRNVPSAGAMYPLEMFIYVSCVEGLEIGLYYYDPNHVLKLVRPGVMEEDLQECFMQKELAVKSSAIIFIAGFFQRSTAKYGERGYRFALIEAGHIAQNLNLAGFAAGYASINLGGYLDARLDQLLGLDGLTQSVIYCVCLGGRSAENQIN